MRDVVDTGIGSAFIVYCVSSHHSSSTYRQPRAVFCVPRLFRVLPGVLAVIAPFLFLWNSDVKAAERGDLGGSSCFFLVRSRAGLRYVCLVFCLVSS